MPLCFCLQPDLADILTLFLIHCVFAHPNYFVVLLSTYSAFSKITTWSTVCLGEHSLHLDAPSSERLFPPNTRMRAHTPVFRPYSLLNQRLRRLSLIDKASHMRFLPFSSVFPSSVRAGLLFCCLLFVKETQPVEQHLEKYLLGASLGASHTRHWTRKPLWRGSLSFRVKNSPVLWHGTLSSVTPCILHRKHPLGRPEDSLHGLSQVRSDTTLLHSSLSSATST